MPLHKKSAKAKVPLTEPELLDYAVKSLASKMKSERDLRRKLADRVPSDETGRPTIEKVIDKLKEIGYLSDARFAADFARLRQENEKFGKRRVQQGLMQKGIASPLANEAITKQYEDVDEVTLARQYIERKRLTQPSGDREQKQKETAKIMRRLVAAGFSSRAIWAVLRDWAGSDVEEIDIEESSEE
ncbi:MAG TPA: regulatory protein RecX [Candidatus Aquilonibacter sp.]|nr:regulatory protein RecX [Candidatus Aquilonibacter sp.]